MIVDEKHTCTWYKLRIYTIGAHVFAAVPFSPLHLLQTGQPMEQLSLVPNLNLRRLIKDLLAEGGEGLYLHRADSDSDGDDQDSREVAGEQGEAEGRRRERGREENRDYRFALVAEQILVLKVRRREI